MKKILVVDDDSELLIILRILLKKQGFDVVVTPKGNDALQKSESFCPQLILLDVFLSGADGRDICNELKQNPKTKNIPVIMFSAHTNFINILNICKADDFIPKPFDINSLIDKINYQIGRIPEDENSTLNSYYHS